MDIRLLGAVAAHGSTGPVELGPRRQRFVLAVLALEANYPVPVERLIELAWGSEAPRTAAHAIEVCVSRLRKALQAAGVPADEATIAREGSAYVLRTDPETVDVYRFQRALRGAAAAADDAGRVALLTGALDLWSGPPLAGTVPPEVEDRLCRGLTDARWGAIEDRIEARLRLGQHGQVLAELADLTRSEPGRERLVTLYATALYRCGQTVEALAVCRAHRVWLGNLGLDPGTALERLEVGILRHEPELAPPSTVDRRVPRELPADLAVFAGRHGELARLEGVVSGVVALSGTAGVGKTTLALHWAHRVAGRYPDGQLYVNLRGFGPGTALGAGVALRRLVAALGVAPNEIPPGVDARAALFRSLLAGRRVLLVLDNARDAEHVRPLIPGSTGSMAVVTSRTNLAGLVATEGAFHVPLDVLSAVEARELLAARVGPEILAAQADEVDEILSRCARLPLALAIASARMPAGPARLLTELRASADPLDAFHLPETTVATVLSWSYRVLGARTARLFRLIGCHPGTDLTVAAAASLAALDLSQARQGLRELVDANLLAEPSPGRYACHDLLRTYAAQRARELDPEPDRRAALERVVDHYVRSGYAADRLVYPARPPIALPDKVSGVVEADLTDARSAWDWLVAEHDNVLAALDAAVGYGWRLAAWRLAWATSTLHQRKGHPQDLYRCWRTVLAALHDTDPVVLRIRALGEIAEACARMGTFTEAFGYLHEAARLSEGPDSLEEKAKVLRTIARTHGRQGDDRAAYRYAAQSLAIFRRLDRPDLVASAANAVGWYAARIGEHDTAAYHLRLALTTAREQGDRLVESHALHSQGYLARRMGRHADAVGYLRECLELARTNGDTYSEATSLRDLGDVYAALGEPDRAAEHWRVALPLLESQARTAEAEQVRGVLGPGPARR